MKRGTFLFLGTGASTGIPMVGCKCPRCLSNDPHNKRLRPSGLFILGEKKLLVDVGPDFRLQALLYKIDHLDGVLLTHTHFDHIAGIDELRAFYVLHKKELPTLVSRPTFLDLKKKYDYMFQEKKRGTSLSAQLHFQILEESEGKVDFLDIPFEYITYEQGGMPVTGYRIGTFAYVSDIRRYTETIFNHLQGVKTLVLSALRKESSFMHFSFEEAISFAKKVGASRTFFTHISHDVDHTTANTSFPKGFILAHDGLKVSFTYG